MKKKIALLLVLVMLFFTAACGTEKASNKDVQNDMAQNVQSSGANAGQDDGSVERKPVVINLSGGDYGYPSPYLHYSRGPGIYKMELVFDSLLEYGENGIIPWLAESYDVSEDGLSYTFVIREGVKWHDGTDLTMEDIRFSFEYQAKYPPVSGINVISVEDQGLIEDMTIDGNRFIVKVAKENAVMLEDIGMVRIIPKHVWENVEDPSSFIDKACGIGCGPYVIADYDKEQGAYKFVAFEDYWGQNQTVDVINFIPVSDSVMAFDNGEIDITGVTPDIMPKYENSDEYKLINNPGFWGYKLAFNMENAPALKDVNVRRAIACAVNREELIDKIARGAATMPGEGYIPTQSIWFDDTVKNYKFDLDAAKAYLNGNTYDFVLTVSSSDAEVRIAELMRLSLAQVGINLTVESVDSKTRDTMYKKGEYQLIINGYGGWGRDPDLLREQYANGVIRGYSNEKINELCAAQILETDIEKRHKIINELQHMIAEEVPQLPLYNTIGVTVYRPSVYDGWTYRFDHHETTHAKISYVDEYAVIR